MALFSFSDAVERLAILRSEEGDLKASLARYDSQFGYNAHFDHERKAILSDLKMRYKEEYADRGEKLSNADADDLAHADSRYRDWLDKQRAQRSNMNSLKADLAVKRAQIEEAIGDKEVAERRLRLQEELIRYARSEMRLS